MQLLEATAIFNRYRPTFCAAVDWDNFYWMRGLHLNVPTCLGETDFSTVMPYGVDNRRSYEGPMRITAFTKAEQSMNHRSVYSDPGFCLAALPKQPILSNEVLKQLVDVVNRRKKGGNLSVPAANFDSGLCCATDAVQLGSCCQNSTLAMKSFSDASYCHRRTQAKNNENRRACVLDSRLVETKFSKSRVKSTSLSSSATSIFSDEESFRSSGNSSPTPSDNISASSGSRRSSFSCDNNNAQLVLQTKCCASKSKLCELIGNSYFSAANAHDVKNDCSTDISDVKTVMPVTLDVLQHRCAGHRNYVPEVIRLIDPFLVC